MKQIFYDLPILRTTINREKKNEMKIYAKNKALRMSNNLVT